MVKPRLYTDEERLERRRVAQKKYNVALAMGDIDSIDIDYGDLTRLVRTKINGRTYIREARTRIDRPFVLKLLEGVRALGDKIPMIAIDTIEYKDDEPKANTKFYVVNQLFLESLNKADNEDEYYAGFGKHEEIIGIRLFFKTKVQCNKRLEGGFFKYSIKEDKYNKFLIDTLKRYQIYSDDEEAEEINGDDNSLIHSLKISGVDSTILDEFKMKCKSSVIPLTAIKSIATKHDLCISVRYEKNNNVYKYGNKSKTDVISLCLVEDHYFVNEETEFTAYAIKNYEDIKKEDKWWKINKTVIKPDGGKRYVRKNKGISSFLLVRLLKENGFFNNISLNSKTIGLRDYNKINIEEMDINNKGDIDQYKPIDCRKKYTICDDVIKELKGKKKFVKYILDNFDKAGDGEGYYKKDIKIAFDFETTTDTEVHKPYMVVYDIYIGTEKLMKKLVVATGNDCALVFLNQIRNKMETFFIDIGMWNPKENYQTKSHLLNTFFNITLYAHNITYDIQFLMKYISRYNPVIRGGNKVCGGSFYFRNMRFNIKDTYAIIDCKLAKFADFFNITMEKEVFPYELYTEENVKKGICKIEDAIKFLKSEEDIEKFKKNIKDLNMIVGKEYFNHIEYAAFYCKRDVDVMMEGYFIFRRWVEKDLGIDIDNFLTISSISDEFFKKKGCYDGCKYINGIARYYIQKTVVGGRCMSRKNKMYSLDKKLNDVDGVSLYPSAMHRLSQIGGYLKGTPKVIKEKDLNMKFLNKQDGYFIRIKLREIIIPRAFPLVSYINDKGVREFTNELDDSNNVIYVNKISLEDIMEFHEVTEDDFEILDGYYFNEGRNPMIGDVIKEVFQLRLDFKAKGNPIQNLFKLIMNSSYGKTIMKEQNNTTHYADSRKSLDKIISRDYNNITEIEQLYGCEKFIIKKRKPINDHFNACHIGSEILAMSKRIMNEVMCLAEDNWIKIYYQDTDSMHIEDDKIQKLSELFKKKYKRELIGKNMGQFHCGFEEIRAFNKKKNIYESVKAKHSIKTIILGKKAYMDIVEYENGETREHCRMKGIPHEILKIESMKDEYKEKNTPNMQVLYQRLYDGDTIEFDLLNGGKKKVFEVGKGTVKNAVSFSRKLSFATREDEDEDNDETIDDVFESIED